MSSIFNYYYYPMLVLYCCLNLITVASVRLWPINKITAFLRHHKHKERTASGGIYRPRLRSHVRPKRPWPINKTTAVPIRLRIWPRCWHYTATQTTPSLVPYYYPTRQWLCYAYSPTDRTIAPIRLRSNNQLIDRAPNVRPTITTWCWHRTAIRTNTLLLCLQLPT